MPCKTGPATADTRAAAPGSTTSLGSASRSGSAEPGVGSVISNVKLAFETGLAVSLLWSWARPCRVPGPHLAHVPSGNKKERVPDGPTLNTRSYMRTLSRGGYSRFHNVRQGPRRWIRLILRGPGKSLA